MSEQQLAEYKLNPDNYEKRTLEEDMWSFFFYVLIKISIEKQLKKFKPATLCELISPVPLARNKAQVIRLLLPMLIIQELTLQMMIEEAYEEMQFY